MLISSMILRNQTLKANFRVFTFFGEAARSCFRVIVITWDVVEDKMISLQQLSNECLHLCLHLKIGTS